MIDVALVVSIAGIIYFIVFLLSLSYSCGGWDKSCGLCWVGIVQAPLTLIDWIMDKIKGGEL